MTLSAAGRVPPGLVAGARVRLWSGLRKRQLTLLGFGLLRFPFTFLGLMALGTGLWVVVYLAGHPGLDPVARGIAAVTVLICLAFGAYVVIRRVRRGPQH